MSLRNHILAVLAGASVPWLAVSLIGSLAAQPTPSADWIGLYALVVSALPTILVSSIAAVILISLGVNETRSYFLSYTAAIVSFIFLIEPWSHGPDHIAGVSAYWDQYLYMLVLPALGLIFINNSLKSRAPDGGP